MINELQWMQQIAEEIKIHMKRRKFTQRDLADKSGLSEVSISRYLNCERLMSLKSAMNIAYALDVEVDALINFEERIV